MPIDPCNLEERERLKKLREELVRRSKEQGISERTLKRTLANLEKDDTPENRLELLRTLANEDAIQQEAISPEAVPPPQKQHIRSEQWHIEQNEATPEQLANRREDLGLTDAEMHSGLNPLPFVRKTATAIRNQEQVKKLVDIYQRTFDPGARGTAARQSEAITRGTIARVTMGLHYGLLKAITSDESLYELIRRPENSNKREAFWRKYTNDEIVKYQSLVEQGKSTGDPNLDKMFAANRRGYDYDEEILRENEVPMGHTDNYIRHAFKNPEAEKQAFLDKWHAKWGQPGFTKTRHYPTLADAIAAGLKPKSYNPERNLMAYHAQVITAIEQVQTLKSLHEEHLAIPAETVRATAKANNEEVDKLADRNGFRVFTTPDKKTWYVRKGVEGVLNNAFDMSSIYNTLAAPMIIFARAFKGTTGIKLSYSIFHPVHIAGIAASEVTTTAMMRSMQGTATGKDALDSILASIPVFGGAFQMAEAYKKYHNILDVLRTGKGWENLSDRAKSDLADIAAGGFVPLMGTERRSQMSDFLFHNGKRFAQIRDVMSFAYHWGKMEPVQEFLFGKVIPAAKAAAFFARRDTLLQKHGEAYRGSLNWKVDMSNIGKETEGRFGEMFYDTLFWNKNWKMVGLAIPLSLGWNLGFVRVHGGAIVDLTDNIAHTDQIIKYLATKGKEGRAPNISNRLIYAVNYHALSMLSNLVISQLVGGGVKSVMDAFFPRIGTKPNGEAERVRTPYWTSEFTSWWEHDQEEHQKNATPGMAEWNATSRYLQNKFNPGLAAVFHVMNNRDFMGRDITNWNDNSEPDMVKRLWGNLGDVSKYLLQDMYEPISFQNLFDQRGVPNEPKQVVAALLGFGQAPGYTTRTPLENRILTTYHDQVQVHMTKNMSERHDAKIRYMNALQGGDDAAIDRALTEYQAKGADAKEIRDAQKHANEPPAHHDFKALFEENQLMLLRSMNQEQLDEYWPLAGKKAKAEFNGETQ